MLNGKVVLITGGTGSFGKKSVSYTHLNNDHYVGCGEVSFFLFRI